MPTAKITKRLVDSTQKASRDIWIWDAEVRGFGLKVTPAGQKIYILQYRTGGRETPIVSYAGRHGERHEK